MGTDKIIYHYSLYYPLFLLLEGEYNEIKRMWIKLLFLFIFFLNKNFDKQFAEKIFSIKQINLSWKYFTVKSKSIGRKHFILQRKNVNKIFKKKCFSKVFKKNLGSKICHKIFNRKPFQPPEEMLSHAASVLRSLMLLHSPHLIRDRKFHLQIYPRFTKAVWTFYK